MKSGNEKETINTFIFLDYWKLEFSLDPDLFFLLTNTFLSFDLI